MKELYLDEIISELKGIRKILQTELSPADVVERKRGEWTDRTNDPSWAIVSFAYCSECKQPIMHKYERPLWNFCPNCGARMKGEDDGSR